MALKYFARVGFAAALIPMSAFASDVQGHCVALSEAADVSTSGCACLSEKASGSVALTKEILALQTSEEADIGSAEMKDAIDACWPED